MWAEVIIGALFGLFMAVIGYGFLTFEFYVGLALLIAMYIVAKQP